MTVFNVQPNDSDSEAKDGVDIEETSAKIKLESDAAPNKVIAPPPSPVIMKICKMTIENTSDSSQCPLTKMISKLSVNDHDENEDDDNDFLNNACTRPTRPLYVVGNYNCAEDEDEKYDRDEHRTEDDDEKIVYTERSPELAKSNQRNRVHPYDGSSFSRHQTETRSPASSTEANDSESSMTSSPDSSPRHSVSIPIPSRHYYGSAGLLTVVSPVLPSRLSTESPEPQEVSRLRRRSLCSGGGVVMREASDQQVNRESPVASSSQQGSISGLPFSLLTLLHQSGSPVQSPSRSPITQHGMVSDAATEPFAVPSPYSAYRDPFSSSSPISSSHSPSVDDCLAFSPSPQSDIGAQQASPLGSAEVQEQLSNSSIGGVHSTFQQTLVPRSPTSLPLGQSESPQRTDAVEVIATDQSYWAPFPSCNIDEVVDELLGEFGVPDKKEVFELYGRGRHKSCEDFRTRPRSASDFGAPGGGGGDDHFLLPQKPAPHYRSSAQLHVAPPRRSNPHLEVPARHEQGHQLQQQKPQQQQQQNQQEQVSSVHISPNTNPYVELKFKEKMESFVKILPKNEAALPASKAASLSAASVQCVTVQLAQPSSIFPPVANQVLPTVSASAGGYVEAIERMRSLSTTEARNNALVVVEQWTVEDLCHPDDNGDTYLHVAVGQRNYAIVYAIVNRLVQKKQTLDLSNKLGQTPLFVAVAVNNEKMVDFFLHQGANAGCVCRDGTTPLHVVANRGDSYYDVAALLCASKYVKYAQRNRNGLTALHCAVNSIQKAIRVAQLLLRSGASLTDQESCGGNTAIHMAVENGGAFMVKALCEAEATDRVAIAVNATNYVQNTPLHLAATVGHMSPETRLEMINVLLMYGAKPGMKNNDNKMPKDLLPPDALADKSIRKALDKRSHI